MLWNNIFMCKIPHIDAQHKALFGHVEKLGAMHGDLSRIPETLDFLATYTDEHFSDEESLHHQLRYPRALEHQRQHQGFVQRLAQLRKEYEASGHNLTNLMTMNKEIVAWLKEHVLHSDKEFSVFYHALPGERKRALRLPSRPWIPESSQGFYQEVTGIRAKPTEVLGPPQGTRRISGSWSDTMLCGIPSVDEQHKELFRQVDILRDRGNKDRIPAVLRFLADYVVKHFNDEEALHRKSRYPKTTEHRKLHEDFVKTFYELKTKFDKSDHGFNDVMEINKVVFDWLKEHVMKVDKEFAKHYLANQE